MLAESEFSGLAGAGSYGSEMTSQALTDAAHGDCAATAGGVPDGEDTAGGWLAAGARPPHAVMSPAARNAARADARAFMIFLLDDGTLRARKNLPSQPGTSPRHRRVTTSHIHSLPGIRDQSLQRGT
jgi:hypothetical protein